MAHSSSLAESSKVWLVTGSSSGFGKRLVTSILARGDRVIATARSLEKLETVIAGLGVTHPDRLRTLQLDIADGEEKIKTKVDEAIAFWGSIDILVNNAGFGVPGIVEEGGTKLLRRQFDTNVFGVLDVTNATLPYLRESKGVVVVVGSRSAWKAELPGTGFYAASKAAIHAITETMMTELAQFGIKVLLVGPGAFRTEGIYGYPFFDENPIPVYNPLRQAIQKRFETLGGTEKGDPDKAVEAIVDVVTGQGVAKGRPWPNYLVLGEDAEVDVRNKCTKLLSVLEDWSDVTRSVSFDTPAD